MSFELESPTPPPAPSPEVTLPIARREAHRRQWRRRGDWMRPRPLSPWLIVVSASMGVAVPIIWVVVVGVMGALLPSTLAESVLSIPFLVLAVASGPVLHGFVRAVTIGPQRVRLKPFLLAALLGSAALLLTFDAFRRSSFPALLPTVLIVGALESHAFCGERRVRTRWILGTFAAHGGAAALVTFYFASRSISLAGLFLGLPAAAGAWIGLCQWLALRHSQGRTPSKQVVDAFD